jgi:hypothetical protein
VAQHLPSNAPGDVSVYRINRWAAERPNPVLDEEAELRCADRMTSSRALRYNLFPASSLENSRPAQPGGGQTAVDRTAFMLLLQIRNVA